MEIKIKDSLQRVLNALNNEHKVFLVGGCIRDVCLGKDPKDYDVVTSATPEQVEGLFEYTVLVGKKFGIVTVVDTEDVDFYEVATLRKDSAESDGRRPDSVEFVDEIYPDSCRRDFTINSMYFDTFSGSLIDYHGGLDDIKNKIIRTVGDPDIRFKEDYLRMLRALRFAVTLGFDIHEDVSNSILRNRHGISLVSKERINQEFCKSIMVDNPSRYIDLLDKHGLLEIILPEIKRLQGVEQSPNYHPEGDVYVHTMKALDCSVNNGNLIAKLSVLLHDVGKYDCSSVDDKGIIHFYGHEAVSAKKAEEILRRLKFPRDVISPVVWVIGNHMRALRLKEMSDFKSYCLYTNDYSDYLRCMAISDLTSSSSVSSDIYDVNVNRVKDKYKDKVRLVNNGELVEAGLPSDEFFGRIVEKAVEKQFDGKIKTKKQFINFCKNMHKSLSIKKTAKRTKNV